MKRRIMQLGISKLFLLGVIGVVPCYGDAVVAIGSTSAAANTTGNSFDITFTNTGPASVNIGGFSFEIALSDPDITLTDATSATTVATYIFAGNSLFGPDILVSTDGQDLIAADIYATPMGSSTVMAGATVGIGHVLFDVSSSAVSSMVSVTFQSIGGSTSLSDENGNAIAIDTPLPGTLTINATAIPEPSSLLMLSSALVAAFALRKKRNWNYPRSQCRS